ncbi:MAG: hypothetical protein A2Y56_05980 [Candidatus Aminicenantes bacterium RBG_13_63_10]|nr:MAG: hypothetical protein A2Y56_05980 [Candidatus Aminicenantes bacterium RBG_13_63_10]
MMFGVIVCLFLTAGLSAGAAETKIKVVAENAAIRLNPSPDSEAVEENVALDKVFSSEKKIGEWFEVKFRTQLGVDVVGYIHEMYVEVLAGEAPPPAPQPEPPRYEPAPVAPPPAWGRGPGIHPGLRLGGMLASLKPGYDWEHSFIYADEDLFFRESVANGTAFGFDAEFGVFVIPFLEITTGFSMASKGLTGTYEFEVPSIFYYNDYAKASTTETVNYKATYISFGLNFHPLPNGRISPYIGLGGCAVKATMDLWDEWQITDIYSSAEEHDVEINKNELSTEKLSKFGFYFQGGVKFMINRMFYVFGQLKYVLAKAEKDHLMSRYYPSAEKLRINLGGLFTGFGFGMTF